MKRKNSKINLSNVVSILKLFLKYFLFPLKKQSILSLLHAVGWRFSNLIAYEKKMLREYIYLGSERKFLCYPDSFIILASS